MGALRRVNHAFAFAVLLACSAGRAQVATSACDRIREPDRIQVLATLDQAQTTLKSEHDEDGDTAPGRCAITVDSPLGQVATGELRVWQFLSQKDGLALLRARATNTAPGVPMQTADSSDVVHLLAGGQVADVIAMHGNTVVELELGTIEPSARANPTWQYRMEREVLQAAGATVIAPPGLPPDPVPPRRPAPSAELQKRLAGTSLGDRLSFWWPFLIGPSAVLVVFGLGGLIRRRAAR